MRKRSRLTSAATGALVLATVAGGCASLPAGGNVQLNTLHGTSGGSAQGVQVLPVPPGPGWSARQIVRGFLAASASFDPRHHIAKEYLTPSYRKSWKPGWAATVIAVPDITLQAAPRHPLPGSSQGVVVNVTSPYVARMTTAFPYEAGNLVVSPGWTQYQFLITDESGHNRISGINLNGRPASPRILLMTQPDFQRDYQTRNLYFFPVGSKFAPAASAQVLIPDPVPIPLQATGVQAVRGLVTSLFNPPPGSSWLSGAATTAFPSQDLSSRGFPGGVPMTVRIVGGIKAVIDLGGAAAKASPARLRRMAAQLYATLTSSPYSTSPAAQIQSVVLEVNHHVVSQPLPPPYASWIPRVGGSDQLYFEGSPKLPVSGVETIKARKQGRVPIPSGLGNPPFSAIAVSPGPSAQVVLAGCAGQRVYLLPQWQGGTVTSRTLPARCTSLSWDPHGNLWLSAGKGAYVIRGAAPGQAPVPPGGTVAAAGPVTKVCFLTCARSGSTSPSIAMLRIAPDGVRVAMIVHSGLSFQVMLSAIASNPSYVYIGAAKPVRLGSDISEPGALAWLDPDHLLVLDHAGLASSQIYEVPLSGGSSTQIATPRYTMWLATSWPDADRLPRVVVGTNGSRPQILSFNAGLLNRGWTQLARGAMPVLPG